MEQEKVQKEPEMEQEESGKIRVGGGTGKWEKLAPYYCETWQSIFLFCQMFMFCYLSY